MISSLTKCMQQSEVHFIKETYKFFPPESVGKQCVTNCAMAIIYTSVMPVDQWQSEHLDCILVTANKLYLTIHSSHDYLMISDIPDVVTEYGGHYKINKYKEMFGTFG